jgi:hypothetical protein
MINATATSLSTKPAESRTRRLLVRMNMTLFYCVGAAVLLESGAARQAARPAAGRVDTPRPREEREHAQWLLEYAASVWPEFAWEPACAAIVGQLEHNVVYLAGDAAARATVSSRHMAMFYRALSRIAEDVTLRRVLEEIASAKERRCAGMAGAGARTPFGAWRTARLTRACVRDARNRVVRRAFDVLQHHWVDAPPFPALDYDCFLSRAHALLAPHMPLTWTERVLCRGWLSSASRRSSGTVRAVVDARDTLPRHAHDAACVLPHGVVLR